MSSILEEFAYGNVPFNAQLFKKDSEYAEVMEHVSCNEQKLLERLGADDKKLFQAYVDMQDEANKLTAVKNLVYGYKLGLLMTAEAFIDIDDLYANANNT